MRLCLAVAVVVLASGALRAQQATFSSRAEAVRVDVLVTDRGGVVRGLRPADFEVLDEGVPQQVDLVSFEELPLNVILAMDMSGSVMGDKLGHLRNAAGTVLSGLKTPDRAAVLAFAGWAALLAPLTNDVPRLRNAFDEVFPGGNTALVDATYAAMMLGGSEGGRDLVLVFSDGQDTASWLLPERVVDAARRSDVVAYGVAVRGSGRASFLRDVADQTGGGFVEITSTSDLQQTFPRILDEFRQRYVVSFVPRGVSSEGWHRLQVRVPGRRATVKARPGYHAR